MPSTQINQQAVKIIPSAAASTVNMIREGTNLKIIFPDGKVIVLENYFIQPKPILITEGNVQIVDENQQAVAAEAEEIYSIQMFPLESAGSSINNSTVASAWALPILAGIVGGGIVAAREFNKTEGGTLPIENRTNTTTTLNNGRETTQITNSSQSTPPAETPTPPAETPTPPAETPTPPAETPTPPAETPTPPAETPTPPAETPTPPAETPTPPAETPAPPAETPAPPAEIPTPPAETPTPPAETPTPPAETPTPPAETPTPPAETPTPPAEEKPLYPTREISKDDKGNTVTTDYLDEDNDGFAEKVITVVRNEEFNALSATVDFKNRDGSYRRIGKIDSDNDDDLDTTLLEVLVNAQGETTSITRAIDHNINDYLEERSVQIGNMKNTTQYFENEYRDIRHIFKSKILPDGKELVLSGSVSGGTGHYYNEYDENNNWIGGGRTDDIWYPAGYKGKKEWDITPIDRFEFARPQPVDINKTVQHIDSDGNGSLDTMIERFQYNDELLNQNTFIDLDSDGHYEKTIHQTYEDYGKVVNPRLPYYHRDYSKIMTELTTETKEFRPNSETPYRITLEKGTLGEQDYTKTVTYPNGVKIDTVRKEELTTTDVNYPNGNRYQIEDRNSDGIAESTVRIVSLPDGQTLRTVSEFNPNGLIHKQTVSTLNADNQMLTHKHTEYDYENGLVYYHTWKDTNGDGIISTEHKQDQSTAQVSLFKQENVTLENDKLQAVKLDIENADGSRRLIEYLDSDANGTFDTTKNTLFDANGKLAESELMVDRSEIGWIEQLARYYQDEQGNHLHIQQFRAFDEVNPFNFNNDPISLKLNDVNQDGYFESLDAANPIAGKLLDINKALFDNPDIEAATLKQLRTVNLLHSYGDVSLTADLHSLNINRLNIKSLDLPGKGIGELLVNTKHGEDYHYLQSVRPFVRNEEYFESSRDFEIVYTHFEAL